MIDDYEIIEKLSRKVCELHADNQRLRAENAKLKSTDMAVALTEMSLRDENDHLKQARSDALAGGDALREEIIRLRAGLQRIVEGDGFWDAPSLARDLLEGKDVT